VAWLERSSIRALLDVGHEKSYHLCKTLHAKSLISGILDTFRTTFGGGIRFREQVRKQSGKCL